MPDNNNLTAVNKAFNELKVKVAPDKKLMAAIAGEMHASVMHNFATQGRDVVPGGWKEKFIGTGKILQRSGGLLRSIIPSSTTNEAIVSTNLRYAITMHEGKVIKAKKILGSVKRHIEVYAMEQYFWRQYYLSKKKEKKYLILALHVHKTGSVTIHARPFMVLTDKYRSNIIKLILARAS